ERAARLVEFHARDTRNPSFNEVLDKILDATCKAPARAGYQGEIQHVVNMVVLNDLMALASGERASNQVRAIAEFKLEILKNWLRHQTDLTRDDKQKAFFAYAANQPQRLQDAPQYMNLTKPNDPTDAQLIGTD